jgi:hypothetical protein
MQVSGLLDVTFFTAAAFVKFDALVGVCKACAHTHPGSGGTVRKYAPPNTGYFNKRSFPAGLDLILFVITGTGLAILIPADGRGYLFLGGCRLR